MRNVVIGLSVAVSLVGITILHQQADKASAARVLAVASLPQVPHYNLETPRNPPVAVATIDFDLKGPPSAAMGVPGVEWLPDRATVLATKPN